MSLFSVGEDKMRMTKAKLRSTIRRVLKESMHSEMDLVIKNIIFYACQEAANFMRNFQQNIVFEEISAMSDADIIKLADYGPSEEDTSQRDEYLVSSVRMIAADKNELKRVLFELVDSGDLNFNPGRGFSLA